MDSRPISSGDLFRFLSEDGLAIAGPSEWQVCQIELAIPSELWSAATLRRGDMPLPLSLRWIRGKPAVVAEWPRSGTGNFRLTLQSGGKVSSHDVTIEPEKLSSDSYERLLLDLETWLPASIAIGLRDLGGLSGVTFLPPQMSTLAEEVQRLKRAIHGSAKRPGILSILHLVASGPHVVLRSVEVWTERSRARRPHPAGLPRALQLGQNIDERGRIARVLDTRVEQTYDVYENRMLKSYVDQIDNRLRRIRLIGGGALRAEADALATALRKAQGEAQFLDDVRALTHAPDRITMVLLKKPAYRAALEGFLEFNRRITVRLDSAAMDSPLANLPFLYQLWGTLKVLDVVIGVAASAGYEVSYQRLVHRRNGSPYLDVLRNGEPVLKLIHPFQRTTVVVTPERSFFPGSPGLRSSTYTQRPDLTVEVQHPGEPTRLLLFDPKYKLDGEPLGDSIGSGKPKKDDIDKMHAYRDAIRDQAGRRVVEYVAILYPGPTYQYPYGVAALSAYPGQSEAALEARIRDVLMAALLNPADLASKE